MLAMKLVLLAFLAVVSAIPAIQREAKAISSPANAGYFGAFVPSDELTKRAPYPLTCNGGNINFEDGEFCYRELKRKGNEGKKCGSEKLCEHGTLKVSGSLWQTADTSFKVNCGKIADAMNKVLGTCRERGGSASVEQTPGWTQFREDLIVVHMNNGWLGRRDADDTEFAATGEHTAATTSVDVATADHPYRTTCNSEQIVESEMSYCRAWLNNFGDAAFGGCTASRLCANGTTKVSSSLWETEQKDYHVSCKQAANALTEIWKVCGSRGGSASARDENGEYNMVIHLNNEWLKNARSIDAPVKNTHSEPIERQTIPSVNVHSSHNGENSTNDTSTAVKLSERKVGPYDFVCNNEFITSDDYGKAITWLNINGNGGNKLMCGNGKLYESPNQNLKVSGTIWDGAPADYKVNCALIAKAAKVVQINCGARGGSASARDDNGFYNVVAHFNNDWL